MKICSKCQHPKDESEFSRRQASPDGLQHVCKSCQYLYRKNRVESGNDTRSSEYWQEYYQSHREHLISAKRRLVLQRKLTLVLEHGGKCVRCGFSDNLAALDFHHTDPTSKLFTIGSKINSYGLERLRREAEKCDLMCTNCHRSEEYPEAAMRLWI